MAEKLNFEIKLKSSFNKGTKISLIINLNKFSNNHPYNNPENISKIDNKNNSSVHNTENIKGPLNFLKSKFNSIYQRTCSKSSNNVIHNNKIKKMFMGYNNSIKIHLNYSVRNRKYLYEVKSHIEHTSLNDLKKRTNNLRNNARQLESSKTYNLSNHIDFLTIRNFLGFRETDSNFNKGEDNYNDDSHDNNYNNDIFINNESKINDSESIENKMIKLESPIGGTPLSKNLASLHFNYKSNRNIRKVSGKKIANFKVWDFFFIKKIPD